MDTKRGVHIEKTHEYTGHKGSIFALAIHDQDQVLYTSGDDGIVARWHLAAQSDEGEGILRIGRAVYALLIVPNHRLLVVGSSDGTVYFVDTLDKKILHTHRKTTDAVYHLHYDEESACVWILQGAGFLSIVDVKAFEEKFHHRLVTEHLRSLVVDSDRGFVYIGTSNNLILVLSRTADKILQHWEAHQNSVFSLSLHKSGRYLLSGSRDAHLNIWDLQQSFKLIKRIPAHNYTINAIVMAPHEDIFVTGSRDKTLKVWDSYSFELLKVIDAKRNEAHIHSVNRLGWIKYDNSLVSCSDDRRIMRWRIHTMA